MQLPLVVFSPVRWSKAFRRPQHLLSRLARNRKVFYFEEPKFTNDEPKLTYFEAAKNLCVVTPETQSHDKGFSMVQMLALAELLPDFFDRYDLSGCDIWTNTPVVAPLFDCFSPQLVIYDANYSAQDSLPGFESSSWDTFEKSILHRADIVVTANAAIHSVISKFRPDATLVQGSVDVGHFFCGIVQQPVYPWMPSKGKKTIGFSGILDNRVDWDLIDVMARHRPEWEIILLGPATQQAIRFVPQRANVKWFGPISYRALPGYLNKWDLALMPYKMDIGNQRNDSAKVREYFAAGLPVVSTNSNLVPLRTHCGRVATSHGHFIESCDEVLMMPEDARNRLIQNGYASISDESWDRTAYELEVKLQAASTLHGRRPDLIRTLQYQPTYSTM